MSTAEPLAGPRVEVAALTDTGTERAHNEDACGTLQDGDATLVVVADGVSSSPGGEVASGMAVEVVLRAFREESPDRPAGQRLHRAVQQANIELYDRAIAVPELQGMATTLTALVVQGGTVTAVHVGDSRLYLVRGGSAVQLTKDHTVAAERVRMGVLSAERARSHPDRSVLTRSLGRELIVNRDRLSHGLEPGDVLVVCSDGLHNVLPDREIGELACAAPDAPAACRALVDAANHRGTADNLTAAVVRMLGSFTAPPPRRGFTHRLLHLLRG